MNPTNDAQEPLRPATAQDLELAEKVVQLPRLVETSNKSTASLLRELGFPDAGHVLSTDQVEIVLKRDPHLADMWFARGTDQRIAGGWGIESDGAVFRVQRYSDGEQLQHLDRCRACAEFVVRYVKFIGDTLSRYR